MNFGPDFLKTGELWSTYFALLEGPREGLRANKSMWAKVQKQKSYKRSNFDDDFDFLEIGELWSTYFDVFGKPSSNATSHQNFVGQSSETKKLLGDQISNYGSDFLEIDELWSKYFEKYYKTPKVCGPKLKKQKSYRRSNFDHNFNFF